MAGARLGSPTGGTPRRPAGSPARGRAGLQRSRLARAGARPDIPGREFTSAAGPAAIAGGGSVSRPSRPSCPSCPYPPDAPPAWGRRRGPNLPGREPGSGKSHTGEVLRIAPRPRCHRPVRAVDCNGHAERRWPHAHAGPATHRHPERLLPWRGAGRAGGGPGGGAGQPPDRFLRPGGGHPGLASGRSRQLRRQPSGTATGRGRGSEWHPADSLARPLRAGDAGRRLPSRSRHRAHPRRLPQGRRSAHRQLQRLLRQRPPQRHRTRRLPQGERRPAGGGLRAGDRLLREVHRAGRPGAGGSR